MNQVLIRIPFRVGTFLFMGIFENDRLDQLQSQYRDQIDTIDRMKDVMAEIQTELGGLRKDELDILYSSPEYQASKGTYEAGFLQFISNKFSAEYIATPAGHSAAEGLLKSIRGAKERMAAEAKARTDKINKVLELLDSDPALRKRYDELTCSPKKPKK